MERNGNLKWKTSEVYLAGQVESILIHLNIDPAWETETNYLALCPFHSNSDTPAFSIDKESGLFMCFAPHCGERGNIKQLVMKVADMNFYEANRFLEKNGGKVDIQAVVKKNLAEEVTFVEFSQVVLDKMKSDFPDSVAFEYMIGRGFTAETLDYFDIGFSRSQNMVTVPMHDPEGNPIGIIGRSVQGKSFKNSNKLPKSKTAWNFHRAKKASDTVIICESSFDAMRIHQSGYTNVVALLGGYISEHHRVQLSKSFSSIIIFTDADEAGRKLGYSILEKMPDKRIMWAADCPEFIYPHSAKDASDLQDNEIRRLVQNAINPIEYESWYN